MPVHLEEDTLYDVRLVERHIQRGLLTRANLEKHRQEHPDTLESSATIDLEELTKIKPHA